MNHDFFKKLPNFCNPNSLVFWINSSIFSILGTKYLIILDAQLTMLVMKIIKLATFPTKTDNIPFSKNHYLKKVYITLWFFNTCFIQILKEDSHLYIIWHSESWKVQREKNAKFIKLMNNVDIVMAGINIIFPGFLES